MKIYNCTQYEEGHVVECSISCVMFLDGDGVLLVEAPARETSVRGAGLSQGIKIQKLRVGCRKLGSKFTCNCGGLNFGSLN